MFLVDLKGEGVTRRKLNKHVWIPSDLTRVTTWAADLFGAASVVFEHPVHKFPMDAWASSLGEGTQDVQKLIIFRELIKKYAA